MNRFDKYVNSNQTPKDLCEEIDKLLERIKQLQRENQEQFEMECKNLDRAFATNKKLTEQIAGHEKEIQCREKESYNEGFRDGQKVTVQYYEKEIQKLKSCKNCRNEKFLSRSYEMTICNDCHDKSNWSNAE